MIYRINWSEYGGALSTAGLLKGETLTLEKLLYGAMLPSGNECSYIIADYNNQGKGNYRLPHIDKLLIYVYDYT